VVTQRRESSRHQEPRPIVCPGRLTHRLTHRVIALGCAVLRRRETFTTQQDAEQSASQPASASKFAAPGPAVGSSPNSELARKSQERPAIAERESSCNPGTHSLTTASVLCAHPLAFHHVLSLAPQAPVFLTAAPPRIESRTIV
jgi:hypothetical protein